MLNGGADTTGQSRLEGRVIDARGDGAVPNMLAARGSAATR